jgi:hypothetical protein
MTTVPEPAELTDAEIERGLRSARQLEHAPEHVIQRALAQWQARPQAQDAPGLLQRVRAALSFDSAGVSPLAFGARTVGGTTRQLLFSAAGHDIDLRISAASNDPAGPWSLMGQVLGPQAQGMVALIDTQGRSLGESALSELGEFRLPAVAPGRYIVRLRIGQREIELPEVELPQAP